ncbi:Similar to hypothetical protein SS1G_04157 [Sclerotinia sclerotiorum 1980]; acc. no. XP_001594350 [Pyronema omphalodes CBS 100304]|uniref:Large ribosomal subunit protein mL50 n=1 Tax=Pyronema omphalodes (strain CBS 100304) TaxID=1076935 RepID=U4L5W3_PYROM|nr:Similar to hypothetical protein SS1G_04157 [Sclerotinia sclerotiorum 1980]; acc. no. XP_001594350 [Pyronema omphalodes CBS 100304]
MAQRLHKKLWGDEVATPVDPYTRRIEQPVIPEEEINRENYVEALDARELPVLGLDVPLGTWEMDSFIPTTTLTETVAIHRAVHQAFVEVTEGVEPAEPAVESAEESQPQWLEDGLSGQGWVQTPVENLDVKFAIVKRILQLTGQKVPDATTSRAKTIADILEPLITRPKPKKLAEELAMVDELVALPNVKLHPTKVRRSDKERVIGRALPRHEEHDHVYEGIDVRVKPFKGHVTFKRT